MILCLEGDKLGKVIDLYFLSFNPKNSAKNQQLGEAALRRTNPIFPPNCEWVITACSLCLE